MVLPQVHPRFLFPGSDCRSFVSCHSQPSPFRLHSRKISMMARPYVSKKDPFRNCVPQTDKHGDLKIKR